MHHHLGAASCICTAGPCDGAGGKPAGCKGPEARGQKAPIPDQRQHHAAAFESRGLEVDATARNAQRRIATGLIGAADSLAEHMGKAADLGDKGHASKPDLTCSAKPHQPALARVRPVHPPKFDLGIVPPPVDDVGLHRRPWR